MIPRRILPLLLAAYAAFYVCRANVEPALNLLAVEHGYDNEQIGGVMAIALGAYAVGKVVFGPLADLFGGKRVLVGCLFGTVAVSFALALSGGTLLVVGGLVVLNRFAQSGGWGGLVNYVGVTFPAARRGTVMGILSTSYDVGNVLALLLCAGIVRLGHGWRALFTVNPAIVLVVGAVVVLFLPQVAGISGTATGSPAQDDAPVKEIVGRLVRQRAFWFATALSFLLTFVRAGFMSWTPRFLYEVSVAAGVTSPMSSSIAKSSLYGVAAILGALVIGPLSDRAGPGRRAPMMVGSLVLLLAGVLTLAHAGVRSPIVATVGIAACGLFLNGPYSLLAGAVSLDVAAGRGAGTAAGIVDAVGYVGASLAAFTLGAVSKRAGWTAAFDVVAAVTFVALVLATFWSWRRPAASPQYESVHA